MSVSSDLERRLKNELEREFCILTGRGATALYLALLAIERPGSKLVLPATLCVSPAVVSRFAGYKLLFCDVNLENYTMDVEHLRKLFSAHQNISAVLAVNIYGHSAELETIEQICRENNSFLIEDAAQSLGGWYHGRPLGGWGDISIISFGHTKIIDAGLGGAVLCNSKFMADRLTRLSKHLPLCPNTIFDRFEEYRRGYYSLFGMHLAYNHDKKKAGSFFESFKDIYIFKFLEQKTGDISIAMERLREVVAARCENAGILSNNLSHPLISLPKVGDGYVPWRFTFLLKENYQKQITDALRSEGWDVSNWYPSLYSWFGDSDIQSSKDLPNASFLQNHVVNLWVEPGLKKSYFEKISRSILKKLDNASYCEEKGLDA